MPLRIMTSSPLQLSLLTVAVAATSAQLSYPYGLPGSPNNGLVYAAGYGYSNYGLRNEGAPPNNPFVFRTAADVFTPEAVPAAVGWVLANNHGCSHNNITG